MDPNCPMPSILDREISSVKLDAFGHSDFSEALKCLIEAPQHHPPYSIGLLGTWGTGKSTIKSLYLSNLQDDTNKSYEGKKRKERIKALTFNAWRYGGGSEGNMKRALLRHVFIELGGSPGCLKDELYNQISKDLQHDPTIKELFWKAIKNIIGNLLPILLSFALYLLILSKIIQFLGFSGDISKLGFAAFATFFTFWIINAYGPTKLKPIVTTRMELPRTSAEEYEELLVNQLSDFKRKNKQYKRIVVFIDDLDRLSAHEMVDGLDAIRTFMEIPECDLPKDLGIIFVISCDENRVAEALDKGRSRNSYLPGAVFTKDDARRYLDRIFQFRLEIPPFPKQDMRKFALNHIQKAEPGLKSEIESKGGQIEHVIDRLIHVDVNNPRNAIQLVNSFVQSWWLAKKREFAGAGSERPGRFVRGYSYRASCDDSNHLLTES